MSASCGRKQDHFRTLKQKDENAVNLKFLSVLSSLNILEYSDHWSYISKFWCICNSNESQKQFEKSQTIIGPMI